MRSVPSALVPRAVVLTVVILNDFKKVDFESHAFTQPKHHSIHGKIENQSILIEDSGIISVASALVPRAVVLIILVVG